MADQGILQSESVFVKYRKIRNLLGSPFIKAFCANSSENICSYFTFENFAQIFIISFHGRIFAPEINFPQSQNFTVVPRPFSYSISIIRMAHLSDRSHTSLFASFYIQTALMFTWLWFLQIAKQNPHVDNWFWGHEGIVCGKTESEPDCLNRQDWSVAEKTIEAIKKDQPTLTFIHFGRFKALGRCEFKSRSSQRIFRWSIAVSE
jgi:hypothetical protein